jgi:S1-C subfamily serine protease
MASLEKTLMQLMLGGPQEPRLLSSAGQWGLVAHKPADEEDSGVMVKEVLPGTAAAAAGLKPGDRLLTIDDRWTDSLDDVYEAASHIQPGTTVSLRVRRGGTDMEVKITPRAGL